MGFNARNGRSDIMLLLRGLQKVGAALRDQQEKECKHLLINSNIRPVILNLIKRTENSIKDNASKNKNPMEILYKKGRITSEKISMVAAGVEQFIHFKCGANESDQSVGERSEASAASPERLSPGQKEVDFRTDADSMQQMSESSKTFKENLVKSAKKTYTPSRLHHTEIESHGQGLGNVETSPDTRFVYSPEIRENEHHGLKDDATTVLDAEMPKVPGRKSIKQDEKMKIQKDEKARNIEIEYAQKLSDRSRERKVPASQISRLMSYGGLAAGLGVGTLAEITRRTLGFKKDASSPSDTLLDNSVFLNEANAERIVNTLCRVRGAALKLGQMLSIQDSTIMNPQLQNVFERVRQSADFMPSWQAEKVLREELGDDWKSKVLSFEPKPFAAASIGQVHLAVLHDNRKVAMKIQYPGVATSIESDIRNLTSTLKIWNIIPPGFFIEHLMTVARRELAVEVDYINEAKCTKRFKELLEPYPEYFVPAVIDDLSTRQVFTTELIDGLPLDKCLSLDEETRNEIGRNVMHLCLMELCQFNFMQTDPNWSNFFYNPTTKKLCLLDFGASREYSKSFVNTYVQIIKAAIERDEKLILKHSLELGFLTGYESKVMENAHVNAVLILGEAFSYDGQFDFGMQDLTRRIQRIVPVMLENRLTPPPEEIYSLHRKLAGVFLLCTKLRASINCKQLFNDVYAKYNS